jgi:alkanesulfonate monooxygenase SsuD/methylene tetrahydromethanopterin reductase-like flavin-dependent oxidoreductase (luciferase family)
MVRRAALVAVVAPLDDPSVPLSALLRHAAHAEEIGLDAFLLEARAGAREPFTVLGALAAATARLHLGALVPLAGRHPGLFAKALASLDVLSGGRALGALVLDNASDETVGEALEVVRLLLSVPAPSYTGATYRLSGAWNEPRRPEVPPLILVLAGDAPAEEWPGAIAAAGSGADYLAVEVRAVPAPPFWAQLCAALDVAAARAGRTPGAVRPLALVRGDALAPADLGTGGCAGVLLAPGALEPVSVEALAAAWRAALAPRPRRAR